MRRRRYWNSFNLSQQQFNKGIWIKKKFPSYNYVTQQLPHLYKQHLDEEHSDEKRQENKYIHSD